MHGAMYTSPWSHIITLVDATVTLNLVSNKNRISCTSSCTMEMAIQVANTCCLVCVYLKSETDLLPGSLKQEVIGSAHAQKGLLK